MKLYLKGTFLMVRAYTSDWQSCGKLCESMIKPIKCSFWTLDQNSNSGAGYCDLFENDEGIHGGIRADGKISGTNQCPGN